MCGARRRERGRERRAHDVGAAGERVDANAACAAATARRGARRRLRGRGGAVNHRAAAAVATRRQARAALRDVRVGRTVATGARADATAAAAAAVRRDDACDLHGRRLDEERAARAAAAALLARRAARVAAAAADVDERRRAGRERAADDDLNRAATAATADVTAAARRSSDERDEIGGAARGGLGARLARDAELDVALSADAAIRPAARARAGRSRDAGRARAAARSGALRVAERAKAARTRRLVRRVAVHRPEELEVAKRHDRDGQATVKPHVRGRLDAQRLDDEHTELAVVGLHDRRVERAREAVLRVALRRADLAVAGDVLVLELGQVHAVEREVRWRERQWAFDAAVGATVGNARCRRAAKDHQKRERGRKRTHERSLLPPRDTESRGSSHRFSSLFFRMRRQPVGRLLERRGVAAAVTPGGLRLVVARLLGELAGSLRIAGRVEHAREDEARLAALARRERDRAELGRALGVGERFGGATEREQIEREAFVSVRRLVRVFGLVLFVERERATIDVERFGWLALHAERVAEDVEHRGVVAPEALLHRRRLFEELDCGVRVARVEQLLALVADAHGDVDAFGPEAALERGVRRALVDERVGRPRHREEHHRHLPERARVREAVFAVALARRLETSLEAFARFVEARLVVEEHDADVRVEERLPPRIVAGTRQDGGCVARPDVTLVDAMLLVADDEDEANPRVHDDRVVVRGFASDGGAL